MERRKQSKEHLAGEQAPQEVRTSVKILRYTLGTVATVGCILLASWFTCQNKNTSVVPPTPTYEEQLTKRLEAGEALSNIEKEWICRYFLTKNVDKYKQYCLNTSEETDRYQELCTQFLKDSSVLSVVDLAWLHRQALNFRTELAVIGGTNPVRDSLKLEAFLIHKSMRANVKDNKMTKTELFIAEHALYSTYLDIVKETTLMNFKRVYRVDTVIYVFDNRALLHIGFRHLPIDGFNDGDFSVLRYYKTYDQLIQELDRILTALEFNNLSINDINRTKTDTDYVFYLTLNDKKNNKYNAEITISRPKKGRNWAKINYVKTFFLNSFKHPNFIKRQNNIVKNNLVEVQLVEGIKIYKPKN